MRKALKFIGRVLSVLLLLLLALVVVANVYVLVARQVTGRQRPTVLGFSGAVVLSGSMSGTIEVDDLIITRVAKEYAVGDIISYESGSVVVTHRIVEVTPAGYITSGDANDAADPDPVTADRVIGRVWWVLPRVGAVIAFLQTPLGMLVLVAGMLLLIELPSLWRRLRGRKGETDHETS